MAMTKVKNLQLWCKKMTEGYRDVEVRDMASSWKSGLAFCAIIHRFRPDLIDYDSLSKENVFENNQLAFGVAEKQLNIPAFLEASDMVAIRVPDKLSIVTYVSQYYNYFHDKPQLGGPGINKVKQSAKKKDVNEHVTLKVMDGDSQPQKDRRVSMGDKCTICNEKVYLLERHIENAKLYHRSCFRKSDLSPTSKVFKRHPYSAFEDDKTDVVANKQRKIGAEKDKVSNETQDSSLDFWKRRAQQKTKELDSNRHHSEVSKLDSGFTVNSKSIVEDAPKRKKDFEKRKAQDNAVKSMDLDHVQSWKEGMTKKQEDKGGDAVGEAMSSQEPKYKTGLAEKFKKLDELNTRNLGNEKSESAEKVKLSCQTDVNVTKPSESDSNRKKGETWAKTVPKAKARQQKKIEPMETEASEPSLQKPAPRYQAKDNCLKSPQAAPRSLEAKTKSPHLTNKTEVTGPTIPAQIKTAGFSLNLPNTVDKSVAETRSSPPPLPSSSPPRLYVVQSSALQALDTHTSPVLARHKHLDSNETGHGKSGEKLQLLPSKPPRVSANLAAAFGNENKVKAIECGRSASPMGERDFFQDNKTAIGRAAAQPSKLSRGSVDVDTSNPNQPATAELNGQHVECSDVVANRSENDRRKRHIVEGLLKSLGEVRKNYDADNSSKTKTKGDLSNEESNDKKRSISGNNQDEQVTFMKNDKVTGNIETDFKKKNSVSQRPKSSFVSQSSSLFDNNKMESHIEVDITKTVTSTTVVTYSKANKLDDGKTKRVVPAVEKKDTVGVPEWKKQLEQHMEKPRAKSADLLSERTKPGDVPLWKIEAERKKEARKGGYVDPEKSRSDLNKTRSSSQLPLNQNDTKVNLTRPLSSSAKRSEDLADEVTISEAEKSESPERWKIPVIDDKVSSKDTDMSTKSEGMKKKIKVDYKFNFEDVSVKTDSRKPPRPRLPPSPHSARGTKGAPGRPPPPKTTQVQPFLRHISSNEIQEKLQEIDGKLTELELKGRTLEDSIRKATDMEEDDLMIAWFELVNEKNELIRKECDYIYLSRQQELELEQHEIDQQLRHLVDKQDKTEEDMKEEEYLVEKLVDIVNQRSRIVDSIDEDRLRYEEEDLLIEAMLQQKGYWKDRKHGGYRKEMKKK